MEMPSSRKMSPFAPPLLSKATSNEKFLARLSSVFRPGSCRGRTEPPRIWICNVNKYGYYMKACLLCVSGNVLYHRNNMDHMSINSTHGFFLSLFCSCIDYENIYDKLFRCKVIITHWHVIEWCIDGDGLAAIGRRHFISEPVIPLGRREVGTHLLTSIT